MATLVRVQFRSCDRHEPRFRLGFNNRARASGDQLEEALLDVDQQRCSRLERCPAPLGAGGQLHHVVSLPRPGQARVLVPVTMFIAPVAQVSCPVNRGCRDFGSLGCFCCVDGHLIIGPYIPGELASHSVPRRRLDVGKSWVIVANPLMHSDIVELYNRIKNHEKG